MSVAIPVSCVLDYSTGMEFVARLHTVIVLSLKKLYLEMPPTDDLTSDRRNTRVPSTIFGCDVRGCVPGRTNDYVVGDLKQGFKEMEGKNPSFTALLSLSTVC